MGWNELEVVNGGHPVLEGLDPGTHAYFVHSYAISCTDRAAVRAEVEYGGKLAAVVARDNMVGTQFHPEKSQAAGLRLIRNFLAWRP
jgi:glutamine amidotransferase